MAKQLNVSLAFTANTNEAISAIKRLQRELNGIATGATLKNSGITQLTPEIQRAMVAAGELQAKLEHAVNLKTGKLDLGLFTDSLKKGGVTLDQYAQQLKALGPAGKQAFTNLAQSILQAEAPLIRCSQKLKEFGTTIANTARWQISSSILHGFMGTISGALGYAQDLNESLNNIRIVTGQSIEEMAQFAKEANKAAKALSTTTTAYTDASLIYYQQGLSKKEVQERADITIKMANVTRDSATEVSNQLTAIWNNFYDGTESLEYYADVLNKLGAATATSTSEIAGGLEKFAAVAETIGLSYEYAAAALATITSNTRQSEEVVGTALKTILARIQGLNLGETLDDGTTLNKYSEALNKIGISIFEQNGELKDMDNILDEMAARWNTLSKAQQVALAQTVAGVRQYNQLISLMDNWNAGDSDSMVANLKTVEEAGGALAEQSDIYAEGWEAARDRMRASAEGLYEKLLNDEFFIDFLDGLGKAIDGVGSLVDAFGGLRGTLFLIGTLVTRIFQQEMTQGLRNVAATIKQLTPIGKIEQQQTRTNTINALKQLKSGEGNTYEEQATNRALAHEIELQEKLLEASKRMTAEELKLAQVQADQIRNMDKRVAAAAKAADEAQRELDIAKEQNRIQAKFEAQKEARKKGRATAGKNLIAEADSTDISAATTKEEKEELQNRKAIIGLAKERAEQQVRAKHGLSSKDSLQHYANEVGEELVNNLEEVIDEVDLPDSDTEKIRAHFQQVLKDSIDKATNYVESDKFTKDFDDYQNKAESAGKVHGLGFGLSKLSTELGKQEITSPESINSAKEQLLRQVKAVQAELEKLKSSFEGEELEDEFKDVADQVEKLENKLSGATFDAKQLDEVLEELNSPGNGNDTLGNRLESLGFSAFTQVNSQVPEGMGIDANLQNIYENASKTTDTIVIMDNAINDSEVSMNNFSNTANRANKHTIDWADGLTQAAQIATGLGAAISSIQSTIDTFNDPDATGWQKIVSVFTSLGVVIPLATSAISLFGKAAGVAGTTATAAMGPFGIALMAIAGIIAIVILAVEQFNKNMNAAAIAAEEATKRAEELTQQYEDLKRAVEDFKDAQEGYESAIEAFEKLTEGAENYDEALKKANAEARQLIEEYGLYNDYTMKNGVITIDPKALEAKRAEMEQSERLAEQQMYIAKIQANNAQINKELIQTSNDTGRYVRRGSTNYFDYKEYTSDELRAIAKILNKFEDDRGGLTATDVQEGKNSLFNYVAENGKALAEITGVSEEALNTLVLNIENDQLPALNQMADALEKATKASDYFAEQLLRQEVEQKYGAVIRSYTNNEAEYQQQVEFFTQQILNNNKDLINQLTQGAAERTQANNNPDAWARLLDSKIQAGEISRESLEAAFGYGIFNENGTVSSNYLSNFKELGLQIAQALGRDTTYASVTGDLEGMEINFNNGSEPLKGSLDDLISMLLNQISNAQILQGAFNNTEQQNNNYIEFQDKIEQGSKDAQQKYGVDFAQVFRNAITSDSKTMDFSAFFGELDPAEVEELRKLTEDQLLELFKITQEDLTQNKFENFWEAFKDGLSQYSIEAYNIAQNTQGEDLAKEFGLDIDEFKAYRQLLLDTNPTLAENYKLLNDLAIKYQRARDAVDALSSKMGEYNSIMLASNPNISDQAKVISESKDALINLLNITPEDFDKLPADFFVENWDLVQDAIEGVDGALNDLGLKSSLILTLQEHSDNPEVIEELTKKINNLDLEVTIGLKIDEGDLIVSANQIAAIAGFTKDAAKAYFDDWGYDIEFAELAEQNMSSLTAEDIKRGYIISSITKREDEDPDYPGGNSTTTNKQKPEKLDRYHTLNKQRDELSRTLSNLSAAKEDAYGQDRVDAIQAEIDALDALIDKNEEYKAAIEANLKIDRAAVEAKGFTIDEETGIITNYEEVMQPLIDRYNEAIANNDTKKAEKIQEDLESMREVVEQYEETVDLLNEAVDQAAEDARERSRKELEKITTAVDFKIEIDQKGLDRLEFIVKLLNHVPHQMIEVIDKLGEQAKLYIDQANVYQQGIEALQQKVASGQELTPEELNTLESYKNALIPISESLMDLLQQIEESIMNELESLNSEIDETISRFDTYNSILGHYANIIKLSGRSIRDSGLLMQLAAQQTSVAMDKLGASNDKYLANVAIQNDIKAQLDAARLSGNQADIDYWTKQYEEITKIVEQAHNDMLASWVEVLEAASAEYELKIETTIQKLKDSISAYGLDGLSDRFDKAMEERDRYLSETEQEYELSKLGRQIQKSIDETDNLAAKRELNKLLDETNKKLAEGGKLSKYQLDYMQAQYEVELAKIALEEAQNAKSTVRLRRDSEGNFGYVYTADADKIADAQQNYEDALYNQQKLTEDYIDEMSKAIIQNAQEMTEALAAIDRTQFETEEEYLAEVNRITEYYLGRDRALREEMDIAMRNSGIVYQETILGQIEGSESLAAAQTALETNTANTVTEMGKAWTEWKTSTTTAMTETGTSSENFSQTVSDSMGEVGQASSTLAGEVETATTNMIGYMGTLITEVQNWRDEHVGAIMDVINATKELNGLTDAGGEDYYDPNIDYSAEMFKTNNRNEAQSLWSKRGQKVANGANVGTATQTRVWKLWEKAAADGTLAQYVNEDFTKWTKEDWERNGVDYDATAKYDTGGYTGSWGPEGKIAVLHEKELVLNQEDTSNLLKTIDFIREIMNTIDSQATMASLSTLSATSGVASNNEVLEQNVTIQAEFPNATDHNEIEEAFRNLVNTASQYANRK